jgi:hypothetical protein
VASFNIQCERTLPQPTDLQGKIQAVPKVVGPSKLTLAIHQRDSSSPLFMQLPEWTAESLIKPPFNHLVEHLEIPRVENNAGVIDMSKAHGNAGPEYQVTSPKKSRFYQSFFSTQRP